ncbi:hypothetical protein I5677_02910 [Mobilitalea sibirica]|uniref:Uncharacterized protein n=1 Tax=Mobilitalea sibirica TaxID=1462919 RepID=A0A8J7HC58_9FIRM|nr:hypothetical protein [Mobilitalea sibirica]MBH1939844.1 hypothetical protein [Mobilitalea sibirica]
MKKILLFLTLIGLVFTSFAGCGSNKKTEEELRDEIRAELEKELEAEETTTDSTEDEKKQVDNQSSNQDVEVKEEGTADIRNKDAIYEFVKDNIVDISRDSFDTWEMYHFDITGDGKEEALLVSTYGADWYNKMEIISADTGVYERIDSDIILAKNGNTPSYQDGLLVVQKDTSGSGIQETSMDIYEYNGVSVIHTLNMVTYYRYAGPGADIEDIGEINGDLTEFTYTLTRHNLTEGTQELLQEIDYTKYDSELGFVTNVIYDVNTSGNQFPDLTVYQSETIRGDKISYGDYAAVIVPQYPEDGSNYRMLDHMPFVDNPEGFPLNFAVFGLLQNTKITLYQGMDDTGDTRDIGNLENTVLEIHADLQTDMSYYHISGEVFIGDDTYIPVEFTLDNMRDASEYSVYKVTPE